ncbi:intradiol ring-cleavage dioxygenase [Phaeobacter gallaeciensis]|uniref:Hydroxyquinol 1,2-dioxygenase n=1 Tax=Phaeobacter gallaeciensis TaxID=60890 RepID=A0AAC9ZDJ5_9RHOB|nr:intradiol ring-cleavage dioxygenase [Phaeobacter gallaeciensis]AHD11892.1 hydroxyquinol 1,2-dioxygenase [Phaeobacter gallaeciensis DSM 26640]ATE95155.1 hydroxyquinol 1,2-dioxygenase [Phaeobacter gallaeciensis]ATE99463.1 hydroxyquinol 1,2-dioxygenase [Phaeobacter gallaeciensis]ATF03860.1 hydroxyquinol 1,2-dioxygenase [Phaeobacter gallaeciensis]ATF08053.1 hydroxyquinol 1,2-dioxygenase [Phaeobacter gallaeciensis]
MSNLVDLSKIDYFTEESSVEAVLGRNGSKADARLAQIWASLIQHLHQFAKDVELRQDEWDVAIDFLTSTGQICDENRQEFILLSDVMGFSMLTDAINNRRPEGATENTVLGPFHVENAPEYEMGANISLDGKGQSCLFEGRVVDLDGNPVEGARIDVWCDNEDGFYDVQQPGIQPRWNNRGVFTTGTDGAYHFKGVKPVSYPIPHDGPVGKLLIQLDRHPYRPAHMHYMVTAPGYEKIVTHTFAGEDEYLKSDAVFGVKSTLVAPFVENEGGDTKWRSPFDFVMVPEKSEG